MPGNILWSLIAAYGRRSLTRIKPQGTLLRTGKGTCSLGKGQDSSAFWREFIASNFLVTTQWKFHLVAKTVSYTFSNLVHMVHAAKKEIGSGRQVHGCLLEVKNNEKLQNVTRNNCRSRL